jgi:hypothetical protein
MPSTQNRYYTNLGQATYLTNTSGINNTQTNIQVAANSTWPTSFPFVLSIDPNLATEELVLVTSGAGSAVNPYVTVRGYDGTTAQPHPLNAIVVPKVCQLDLAEPQVHLNLSGAASGAHGLPSTAWTGGTYQLIWETTLATPQSSVSISSSYFSAIPSTANNVVVFANVKTSYTGANAELLTVQLNGYTGANYGDTYTQLISGGSPTAFTHFTATQGVCGLCWASSTGPGGLGRNEITFPFFNDTVWTKGYKFSSGATDGTAVCWTSTGAGACSQITAAISSLTFMPQNSGSQFLANSLFALYCY